MLSYIQRSHLFGKLSFLRSNAAAVVSVLALTPCDISTSRASSHEAVSSLIVNVFARLLLWTFQ